MNFAVEKGCFSYGAREILREVAFSVGPGEILSVLGPNGVGKTTLLRCMMGFLKWKSGRTLIDGRDILDMKQSDIWKKIAYVPQSKISVFSYTALEMVLMGRTAHLRVFALPTAEDRHIAETVMEEVGITSLRGKKCSQLSGGELQMVLIARAMTARPLLLILDEPESNLDFKNQLIVLQTIRRMSAESGIAAIVNTHYPAHALQISDKSLILTKEGVNFYGPSKDIVSEDNMRSAFDVRVLIRDVLFEGRTHKSVIPVSVAG
ncbi:MAG: ABC transporter ATP-binding protein [Synergistaceae bacterium]|jgi:iron complex transport system ATP-binding protein|nr:ABC transporter ATP-binding protein [Synergistaceae bacterium]